MRDVSIVYSEGELCINTQEHFNECAPVVGFRSKSRICNCVSKDVMFYCIKMMSFILFRLMITEDFQEEIHWRI